MHLKKIAAGAAMAGALGFTALGFGAGVANAEPSSPVVTEIVWQQDRGHGGDWGHDDHRDWGDRGGYGYGGDYGYGGNYGYGPGWGCITGPFGHISWCP